MPIRLALHNFPVRTLLRTDPKLCTTPPSCNSHRNLENRCEPTTSIFKKASSHRHWIYLTPGSVSLLISRSMLAGFDRCRCVPQLLCAVQISNTSWFMKATDPLRLGSPLGQHEALLKRHMRERLPRSSGVNNETRFIQHVTHSHAQRPKKATAREVVEL